MATGIGYLRVSTDEQRENGNGLDRQQKGIEEWAAENGVTLAAWYQDDCSGTIDMHERPQGREMIAHVKRGGVDMVIADTVCRFTRPKFDEAEYIVLRYEFERRYGVQIVACDMPTTGDRFADSIIGLAKAKGAKEEREKIVKRNREGRRSKAAKGRWVGAGNVPYGYRKVATGKEARLAIFHDESAVVKRMFAMYARGGYSLYDIARMLTGEGINPPSRGVKQGKKGRGWYRETVRLILKNTTYIGQVPYSGKLIELPELAIIDRETFSAAQRRMEKNFAMSKRNRVHDYLLSGYLHCACGGSMAGHAIRKTKGPDYFRYDCARQNHYKHLIECREPPVNATVADAVLWNWLAGLLREPELLNAGLLEYADKQHGQLEDKHARLETLADLIAKGERQVRRLAADLAESSAKADDDDPDDEARNAIKAEMQAASKRLKAYRAERDAINDNLAQVLMTDERRGLIIGWAAEINQGINDGDVSFAIKRQLLDWFEVTVKIEYREGQRGLFVTCALPFGEKWIPLEFVTTAFQR
jgi:DNA invertase Pin-like site-specific DNA recombinase